MGKRILWTFDSASRMTYDEAIRKVHGVGAELAAQCQGDLAALKRALKERRQWDPELTEAMFRYEQFHRASDKSSMH